jgi:hypothetical protein
MSRVLNVKPCRSREARRLIAIGILLGLAAAFLSIFVPSGNALAAEPITATRYEQTDRHILKTGSWSDFAKTVASGGSYGRSSTSGASVTIYFHGTRLDWIGMKGTTTGTADVYLDGELKKTVNLSAPTAVYNVSVWSTDDLPEGDYKVEIVRRSDNPSTKYITVDAVDVVGTLSYPQPTITGLNPSYGPPTGGNQVIITGKWFYDVSGPDAVTFDGVNATSYTVTSPTRITAVAPAHELGTVQVQVLAAAGPSKNAEADDYTYKDVPAPTITALSPDGTSTAGGASVTISGADFIGLSGGSAVTSMVSRPDYAVVLQQDRCSPSSRCGDGRRQVTAVGGTSANTAADDFAFLTRHDQIDYRLWFSGGWSPCQNPCREGIYNRPTKGHRSP